MRSRAWVLALAAAAIGCTDDFSSFRFAMSASTQPHDSSVEMSDARAQSERADAAADSGGPAAGIDSGAATFDAATDAAPQSIDASDASSHDGAVEAGPSSDAGPVHDSGMSLDDDAGGQDASTPSHVPTDVDSCVVDWNARMLATSCASCACGQCTSPVLDCLARGSAGENALCGDLLACALAHQCHDWDCYCSTMECRANQAAPDGPCIAEMEAAAGGGRNQVFAVHQANDPNQPLVRAVRAIGCTTGQSRGAVGGMMSGKCSSACSN